MQILKLILNIKVDVNMEPSTLISVLRNKKLWLALGCFFNGVQFQCVAL